MRVTKIEWGLVAVLLVVIGYLFIWPLWGAIKEDTARFNESTTAPTLAKPEPVAPKELSSTDVCKREDVKTAASADFYNQFVEDGRPNLAQDPQYLEIRGAGIAKTRDGLARTVTCHAVIKLDGGEDANGPVSIEMHDYIYVVAFQQPTRDLRSIDFYTFMDDSSFKQVFVNGIPIDDYNAALERNGTKSDYGDFRDLDPSWFSSGTHDDEDVSNLRSVAARAIGDEAASQLEITPH